jgi:hypothetical protein
MPTSLRISDLNFCTGASSLAVSSALYRVSSVYVPPWRNVSVLPMGTRKALHHRQRPGLVATCDSGGTRHLHPGGAQEYVVLVHTACAGRICPLRTVAEGALCT